MLNKHQAVEQLGTTAHLQLQTPAQARTPKEYPFYEPILYPPAWKLEMADVDRNYALIQTPGKVDLSLDKLLKDTTKPILFIGKPVYEGIMEMAKYASDKYSSEVAAYFLYTQMNQYTPHWEVYGWFMTGQTASGAEVEMEGSDMPRYLNWLKTKHPELWLRTQIGHAHSHVMMQTFWSGVDLKQQTDRSQLAPMTGSKIFLVVNAKKEIKGKFIQYTPVKFEIDDITIGVSFNNPEYLTFDIKDQKEKIHGMVDALLEKRSYAVTHNYAERWRHMDWFKSDLEMAEEDDARGNVMDVKRNYAKRSPSVLVPDDIPIIVEDYFIYEDDPIVVRELKNKVLRLSSQKIEYPLLNFVYAKDPYDFQVKLANLVEWIVDSLAVKANSFLSVKDTLKKAADNVGKNTEAHDVLEVFLGTYKESNKLLTTLYYLLEATLSARDVDGDMVFDDYIEPSEIPQLPKKINEMCFNILSLTAMSIFLDPLYEDTKLVDHDDYASEIITEAFNEGITYIDWNVEDLFSINTILTEQNREERKKCALKSIDSLFDMLITI